MIESAWLFIGAVSVLTTFGAVTTPDDGWAIVLGIVGFFSWAVFAYASFELTVVTESVTYEFTMPIVAMYAVIMSFVPLYVALTGPAELINRYRNPDTREI